MSTSLKRSHGALSNLGPAATNGGDQLWKFQIRKENQVILEKIEALTKAGQALPDQLNKRFNDSTDMIEALAAKVTKIENDTKQIMEERDKSVKERDTSVKEIARLRNQMQTLFQMLSPEGECRVPLLWKVLTLNRRFEPAMGEARSTSTEQA